jgi:hypothetical protein
MMDPKLQEYMDQTLCSFTEAQNEIADALQRIKRHMGGAPEVQRVQLLALRRYLRKGVHQVALAWPWNEDQAHEHADQTAKMKAQAELVKRTFKDQNPGLTLDYTKIRDLARQVRLWCGNGTVHKASSYLLPRALKELAKQAYPEIPTDWAPIDRFKRFLKDANVIPEPTSAAPGTSDHGQDRAVDFVVKKNGVIIADIIQSTIQSKWIDTGYMSALKAATLNTDLTGPLMKGNQIWEPWHYSLKPPAAADEKKTR